MRLFIAINLPGEVQEYLQRLQGEVLGLVDERQARLTCPRDFHLTLKFLGDVEEEQAEKIKEKLRGMETGVSGSFNLQLGEIGFFGSPRMPKVIWVGILESQALMELQKRVESAMTLLGFPKEDRSFAAHLTLARVKFCRQPDLTERVKQIQTEAPEFNVKEFALMQSFLSSQGAKYEKVEEFSV